MKKNVTRIIFSGVLSFISCISSTAQIAVTTDFSKKYQTMEGFGCFAANNDNWAAKYDAGLVDKLVNDLGMNISRLGLSHNFESSNDNNDPNVMDLTKFNVASMKWEFDYWKSLKSANPQIKLIVSIWTPPVWMKENAHACEWGDPIYTCGGRLKYNMYEEFAERCVAFVKILKQETGHDLYAFSLQNELAFDQQFVSCVYTPQEFVNILKVVGPRFKKEGITTKIFGPEDIGWYDRVMQYINGALNDATAKQYLDIVAVHGYATNGVTPNSPDATTWKNMAAPGLAQGKPLWMTETSGYGEDFASGMRLGRAMYTALKWGSVSGWVWWQASRNPTHSEALFNYTTNHYPAKYHVSKQYFKYIKPGAVSIDVTSTDVDILPLAFHDNLNKTMTYLFINNGTSNKSISLKSLNTSGISLPTQYNIYRTSSNESVASVGTVATTGTLSLPANSVTTLQGSFGTTSTSDVNNTLLSAEIYPNPANESITLSLNLDSESDVKVTVMDLVGKEVDIIAEGRLKSISHAHSIRNLDPGIYFVLISIKGQPSKTIKLVVE